MTVAMVIGSPGAVLHRCSGSINYLLYFFTMAGAVIKLMNLSRESFVTYIRAHIANMQGRIIQDADLTVNDGSSCTSLALFNLFACSANNVCVRSLT